MAAVLVLLIEHTMLPGRGALRILALSPMLIPPFIGAISWIGLFGPSGLVNGAAQDLIGRPLWTIYGGDGVVVLLALHSYPIAYLLLAAALARIPAELEEAARASGAWTRRALRDVTLPLLRPALISSFVLVTVSNLADFGIPAWWAARSAMRPWRRSPTGSSAPGPWRTLWSWPPASASCCWSWSRWA